MIPSGCSNQTTGALPLACIVRDPAASVGPPHLTATPLYPTIDLERPRNTGAGAGVLIDQKTIVGRLSCHWLRLVRLLCCMDMHRCSLMKERLKNAELLIYESRYAEENIKKNLKIASFTIFNTSFLFCIYLCQMKYFINVFWTKIGRLVSFYKSYLGVWRIFGVFF